MEATPEAYVTKMVEVFREVKRVLRTDGTLWLNLGDSYAGSGKGNNPNGKQGTNVGTRFESPQSGIVPRGLKPKDLVGIPWRVAIALQADGWYLRSDIIWSKPNPMPESVTDRPTKSHEYLFLLTKSSQYFYDQEAVRKPSLVGYKPTEFIPGSKKDLASQDRTCATSASSHYRSNEVVSGRNLRTVWTIPTQPFKDAHFSTFPEKLVEPCIRAGTSEKGCCTNCGTPWERIVKKSGGTTGKSWHDHLNDAEDGNSRIDYGSLANAGNKLYVVETVGWQRACDCSQKGWDQPCLVLDPFCGSGTTGTVALKLQRNFIGLELNPSYVEMAKRRIGAVMPLFEPQKLRP